MGNDNLNYLETLLRNNPGIFLSEKDYSQYRITPFFNRITLVIGSSKVGAPNLPILLISPENAIDVFGDIDTTLERKGSYFHRTIQDMLSVSPVIALNIRDHDRDLDKYNWINISTSSDNLNSNTRSNSIIDFYNTNDGFWRRDTDEFLSIVKNNLESAKTNPLNFVNQKDKPCSLLLFKSNKGGFDIPVEEWYNGNHPDYLYGKDYISEYMIEVIAIEGEWNNYIELSKDIKYSKFFTKEGIKTEYLEEFLKLPNINTLKRWNCSLIPYMLDKYGNDMFIQTVINNDVNETGIFCSYDVDIIDDGNEIPNKYLDILGDNLTKNKKPQIDFLSYKRYATDFLVLEETLLDSPNNSFGNHLFNFKGRTQIYSEGYVHGVSLKKILSSSTSSLEIRPFETYDDESYGIINGVKIPITNEINDYLDLDKILDADTHISYVILLTDTGIQFRLGKKRTNNIDLFLPIINPVKEIVLGYYEFIADSNKNITSKLYPVTIDSNGFISPFIDKINIVGTSYDWMQEIFFDDINNNYNDYNQNRIYHLWYWLSLNLKEKSSLIIDINGNKQPISWIEQGKRDNGRFLRFAVDKSSNIDIDLNNLAFYIKDLEFLSKNKKWDYNKPPLSFGTNGIVGFESIIKENYLNGFINSGDPFFWSFSEEENVEFFYDAINNQNLIIIENYSNIYNRRKVVVENSIYNDGIFNCLAITTYKDSYAIVVSESVVNEKVDYITFYDASKPYIINLYDNGYTTAIVEIWNGSPEELYMRLKKKKDVNAVWSKTLEVKSIVEENKIIVDYSRYASKLEKGYFLLSKNNEFRNWTRIIDLQRLNDTELLITCNNAILFNMVENTIETNILKPLYTWIETLDFKVLNGFKARSEVFPDGTDNRLKEILSLLNNTKMAKSLTTDKFDYRYLVDSYGGGLYPNSKQELSDLSRNKIFCLGFINTPSIKTFKKDGSKYTTNNMFDTNKLLSGGDRKNNIGDSFSLASNASHSVYLAPWVSVYENNRYYIVPPSSHIVQIFMDKHNKVDGEINSVVAGIMNSKIPTIDGLEERFSDDDLNNLNSFGITAISNYDNQTFYLFNEKTAYNVNGSVLNYTHNRETLIELELSLYKALNEIQWQFITDKTKKDIINVANEICKYYNEINYIGNYKNTFVPYTDSQLGVLYTEVELSGTLQTLILNISVLKTGGLSISKAV